MRILLVLLTHAPALAAPPLDIQTVTSKKGIAAWLVEDHSIPVLSIDFALQARALRRIRLINKAAPACWPTRWMRRRQIRRARFSTAA